MAEEWGVQTNLSVIDHNLDLANRFVIDAGCGAGALSRKLAERGARVLGIEPEPAQAASNKAAEVVANVGFAECGAEKMPVEPASVDGVVFCNSLHHVPAALFADVFKEVLRVLKPDGWLYLIEPVANGPAQHVMGLFHNETQVRLGAYKALCEYAVPDYAEMREIYYDLETRYESFAAYAQRYANLGYNSGSYTADMVATDEVKARFDLYTDQSGAAVLMQPMRVNYFRGPQSG